MFETRSIQDQDVPDCVTVLNHIIAPDGSTAYSKPYSEPDFAAACVHGAPVSNVTFADEPGYYSVGSFTDHQTPVVTCPAACGGCARRQG